MNATWFKHKNVLMIASLLQVNKNNTDDDDYYYLKPLFYMMADKFEK